MSRLPRRFGSAAARRRVAGRPAPAASGSPGGDLVDLVLHLVEVLVRELLRVAAGQVGALVRVVLAPSASRVGVGVGGDAARAGDERRVDLLDLARGVLERLRHVLVQGLTRRGAEAVLGPARLALLGSLSITRHDGLPASGSPGGSCAGGTTCRTSAA